MRRWSFFLTAFSLLAMGSVGCWEHTAGVCDCDPWHDHHGMPEMYGVAHSYADVPHAGGVTHTAMPQAAE
jgi:hypothetical protein